MEKYFKQLGEYDCMLACFATLLQEPIDQLFDQETRTRVEANKGLYGNEINAEAAKLGLMVDKHYWSIYVENAVMNAAVLRNLLRGRRAFLQVPSLNNEKSNHLVYWTGEKVFDPSNKQRYTWIEQLRPSYVWIFDENHLFERLFTSSLRQQLPEDLWDKIINNRWQSSFKLEG